MPESSNGNLRLIDGSTTFEGGVDSGRVPTVQSEQTPTGLKRNQLAWMSNATVRGGGISPRFGWLRCLKDFIGQDGLFQGAAMYRPDDDSPYMLAAISGNIYRVNVWTDNSIVDLSAQFGLFHPATLDQFFFCQGENVMVIQAGDYVTLPLFWDGTTLRRSNGILPPNPGRDSAIYTLTPTAQWQVTGIGTLSAVVTLTAPYPGVEGDIGSYGVIGRFGIENIVGNTVQFRNIDSVFAGFQVSATPAQFSVEAVQGSPNAAGTSEIPSGRAMDYFMGRLWVQVSNRTYAAGDIAFKGAVPYNRQSFLQFTENAYLAGGGTFNIPSQGGNIRAIFSSSNLDTALGQGELYIGTNEAIYGITVPVDRISWGEVNNENHMPLQRVVQIRYGPISDRSIVKVNGDVFYQAYDGIRSLQIAIRYFHQWGQLPISRNENRALQFNDRTFYRFASGIEFDNRLLQTVLPFQTPRGVAHRGLLPLDFDILNSLDNREAPAWEGILEGLDIMQVVETSFGGRQRAFAVINSRETGMIEFWELTNYSKFDNDDTRISYYIETPAYTWGDIYKLKELDSGELWFDRVFGTVEVTVEYRQDQNPCWNFWKSFEFCSARSTCEDVVNPVCYPEQPYDECYKVPLVLPKPPINCDACNLRPSNHAYQFQFRITVKGFARLRSCLWYALPRMRQPYSGLVC